ncbi:MAG: PKD domain-containing protein, partial [Gammaproteobacteria bacterium]|nr:PKD domain-containing protein [Gammaproteobacteria bacterium]
LGVGEHTLLIIGKKIVDGKEVWQDATEEVTKYVWSVNTQYYFSASDGAGGDVFGVSVAVSSDGSTIVAGASEDDGSGSVYVYNWTGNVWNQAKLKATDGTAADRFGQSVAISSDGSTVVVGATADDDNGNYSGSAYVYSWTGNAWNQTKIIATDGAADDTFGWSVAVSSDGSTVVVSAPGDDDNGDSSGSAYVYSRTGSTWNQTKIMATDGAASDYFGWSVAVSSDGSTIIVGAYCDDDNGSTSGSAYVYSWTGSTWYQTKIIATDGAADDAFGRSVAVSSGGSTVIIGAHGDDDNGNLSGSAYVYNWTGSSWNQTKIISSDGAVGDLFGWSVAVSSDGSTIIVGAYGDGDNGNYSGSAYVYNWTGSDWDQTKIIATDGAAGDYFGYSVAVSSDGNTIIVGSYCDNNEQGSVHLFYQ